MVRMSTKTLLVIAIGLSLATSLLVYNYLRDTAGHPKNEAGQSVVVATQDISPRTIITPDMVKTVQVPPDLVAPGAFPDVNSVVGLMPRVHIMAGEQIVERRLVIKGKTMGFTGEIPSDKRAVTIAVNEISGVAGFVRPGDYVDLIATFDKDKAGDNLGSIILQNVLILAVNQNDEEEEAAAGAKDNNKNSGQPGSVTVAVNPTEAARLALAEDKGKVKLALRPYMATTSIPATYVATLTDILGSYYRPPESNSPAQPAAPAATAPPAYTVPPAYNMLPGYSAPAVQPASSGGVTVIRGTKVESVPVN